MTGKNILVVFVVAFLALGVSADIISINSGGSNNLVINPARYLEGFFFSSNHAPFLSNVLLYSTSGNNYTTDNLTVTFSGSDADGDTFTNITDWRLNGNSISVLNMPFDKNVESVSSGAIRDYSTYENNGTLGGGNSSFAPTWNSNCQVGGCYQFNGAGDYIHKSTFSGVPGSYMTLSAWIKTSNSSGLIMSQGRRPSTVNGEYIFRLSGGKVKFWDYNGGYGFSASNSIHSVNDNNWHYVVFVKNGTSGKFYIDGAYDNSVTAAADVSYVSNDFVVGKDYRDNNNFFNGSIDEVQVFNRALSSEQIKEMYDEELAHHHVDVLVSNETHRGDTWQVAVTPDDKITDGNTILSNNLTIQDAAPNDPRNVNLISVDGTNQSNSDLKCSYFVSDPDDTTLTSYVRWFRNNTLYLTQTDSNQGNATNQNAVLGSGNLTLRDTWYCSVRSYDGSKYSNWVNSNNLTIIDTTPPNVTIISPNATNYTTLNVDFNVSATDNEAVSSCEYSLDGAANVTMTRMNSTYYSSSPSLGPGPHGLWFYCNDTSGNWGSNYTNFTIDNSAAIAISLSDALLSSVKWNVVSLPISYLGAIGNNLDNATSYYINVSATNTLVDLYVKADGDLHDSALDTLGLGNETYATSTNDSTVSNVTKSTMSTNYTLIGDGLSGNKIIYMKFYLNAPATQPAGTYLNSLMFKAVRHGQAA